MVAYKDRLTRFGYELIEDLIKDYSNGNIIIEDSKEIKKRTERRTSRRRCITNIKCLHI